MDAMTVDSWLLMTKLFFKLSPASDSAPKSRLGPGLLAKGRKHSVSAYY